MVLVNDNVTPKGINGRSDARIEAVSVSEPDAVIARIYPTG